MGHLTWAGPIRGVQRVLFSGLTSAVLTTTYFTTHHRNVNYALPVAGAVQRELSIG